MTGDQRNPMAHRAAVLAAKRIKRQLVCDACLRGEDFVFGRVHSDRKCARCKREPVGYGAVIGPDAWAGSAPFG